MSMERYERYSNRQKAGERLAHLLLAYAENPNVIILALPRGGIPVAFEIAKKLHAPLYPYIVRKIGVPGHQELAMGAIAQGNTTVFNEDIIRSLGITQDEINAVIEKEKWELERREAVYLQHRVFPTLKDKIIILVDDGIATGATMKAAIAGLRQHHPHSIVIAVPVCDISLFQEMRFLADEMVCPLLPHQLIAVGAWYEVFDQVEDAEVENILRICPHTNM